jgi:predicted anti-sigma-YlaC factor YlaD
MRGRVARTAPAAVAIAVLALFSGCSPRQIAIHSVGKSLSEGTASFARDDDPDLVWAAVPFGLKTIESLLDDAPRDKNLLLAAARGFTQYAFGSLQQDADFVEAGDVARATALRERASRLYRRALDYGFRGLEVDLPGFRGQLHADASGAVAAARARDVPLLYWTATAWALAIGLKVDDAELAADQDLPPAMMRRALELDEAWGHGSIHDFFITWEGARASVGGSYDRAREHYDRALSLSKELRAWPMVRFAESVALPKQDRKAFDDALRRALAVQTSGLPDETLSNVLAQRRARWLLARGDELFVE